VLLNNDVIAGPNAIDAMLDAAEHHCLRVASPSLLEGPLDYDYAAYAPGYTKTLAGELRRGWFHGVCFAIRRDVFHQVGYPDTDRLMWGHEDKEYLVRCLRAGVPVGTVGGAVFHHFGSITQQAMKREQGIRKLGDHRHAYRRMGLGWWQRRLFKRKQRRQTEAWSRDESARHGMTLHMLRENGHWRML
jgi:GT2 family glycosyltransferase